MTKQIQDMAKKTPATNVVAMPARETALEGVGSFDATGSDLAELIRSIADLKDEDTELEAMPMSLLDAMEAPEEDDTAPAANDDIEPAPAAE